MLFSSKWQNQFNRELHITGFSSFDRMATILAAIDAVPSVFVDTKGRLVGVGGLLYQQLPENPGMKKLNIDPAKLVRAQLISSCRDLNWMNSFEKIPIETLPCIRAILVLRAMYIDAGYTVDDWEQNYGNALETNNLDAVSRIINKLWLELYTKIGLDNFQQWLQNTNDRLNIIYREDRDKLEKSCNTIMARRNVGLIDASKGRRTAIFNLLSEMANQSDNDRIAFVTQGLTTLANAVGKKGGGSRKRRPRRRRKTRRKKKRRKRKTIRKRRKKGRKTRRK